MPIVERLEEDLREALVHLYDPLYDPPASLRRALVLSPTGEAGLFQQALVKAIENLDPGSPTPQNAPARRVYELLHYRYVQRMKQETTADRLGLSTRYLREQESKAIRVLARLLAQRENAAAAGEAATVGEAGESSGGGWVTQVQQELAALDRSAPRPVADVAAIMRSVVGLGRTLTRERDITFRLDETNTVLMAEIHPSALRQVLLAVIKEITSCIAAGSIVLRATLEGETVNIAIEGAPTFDEHPYDLSLVREILASHTGAIKVTVRDNTAHAAVSLPALPSKKFTVMVVDDNADLVSFYRSHLAGTRYEIVHVPDASSVFPQIEAARPDIIVLDVMLPDPDIDGWELLVHLHEHPIAHAIPVIICSVVRDEDLALALGAVLYLPKPVRRQQFIRALDEALARSPGE